jgi:hypothetical protein
MRQVRGVGDKAMTRPLAGRLMTTVKVIVPMVIAIGLLAGCTTSTASPPVAVVSTAAATATPTVTVAATSAWPPTIPLGQAGVIGVAPSPPFPTALAEWRRQAAWNTMPRAFTGNGWTTVSGPSWSRFPSTMNGCDDQRFLVRWRAVSHTAQVAARWVNSGEALPTPDVTGTAGKQVIANAGWMQIDGCQTSQFRLVRDSSGSTLTDVTVDVQQLVGP